MEIVGDLGRKILADKWLKVLSFDMDDVLLELEPPFDHEKGFFHDHKTMFFELFRCHNDIGDTRLILEADENEAFGCTGTLTADNRSGYRD